MEQRGIDELVGSGRSLRRDDNESGLGRVEQLPARQQRGCG
jgi:hypothetical protein